MALTPIPDLPSPARVRGHEAERVDDTRAAPDGKGSAPGARGAGHAERDVTGLAAVRQRMRTIGRWFAAYDPDDADAPAFRAAQLEAVSRFTPAAMLVNLANVALLMWLLGHSSDRIAVFVWGGCVVVTAMLGLRGWSRRRGRGGRPTASLRSIRRATREAAWLGGLWGALPALVFPTASQEVQFLLGMVTTGMLCAGGFALSSVPSAATAYVIALWAGASLGLVRWDDPIASGVLVMMALYVVTVVYSVWNYAKTLGARLAAEAQAERQRGVIGLLLRDFEDHASDLLWETDARGRFAHVTPRLVAALGLPPGAGPEAAAWRSVARRRAPGEESRRRFDELRVAMAQGLAFRDRPICVGSADGPRWWSLSARPLRDAAGRLQGWRGVATDITDRQRAYRHLRWLAHNDALTGLVNRTQFRERLQTALAAPPGEAAPLAVLLLDLDGFKQVNDTRGHAAGDQLLRVVAERLQAVARRTDVVARLGGDEFALVVGGIATRDELEPMLSRLDLALSRGARVAEQTVSVRASIGVAFFPSDAADVDTLMRHADAAMYAAKHEGGQRWRFFDTSLVEVERRRGALAVDLRDAVARGELRLEFQPQVDSSTFEVRGFEALLRWQHPEHGAVPPSEFVAVAESAGLMVPIGEWVLDEACRHAREWPAAPIVSINVSAKQLAAPGFVERVRSAARGLAPDRVELEITESALVEDTDAAVATLRALRESGFRLALDDFGTGYSALGYLRRFPFDTLKIDRSFVTDLASDGEAQVIVDTIVAMARSLGLRTVAEGVESRVEATMLRDKGCTLLQGWLVSRPLPAASVAPFLAHWHEVARPLLDEAA
jgi:diguanylate cyclase (GGDEF)-like protein